MEEEMKPENGSGPNTDNDYLWRLLIFIIMDKDRETWEEFTKNLLHKDRFSSSHKIIEFVQKNSNYAESTIMKGTSLYRARIYPNAPMSDTMVHYLNNMPNNDLKQKKQQFTAKTLSEVANAFFLSTLLSSEDDNPFLKDFFVEYEKWKKKRFKGFKAKDSGMPPAEKASAGRANPEQIAYLYLSEDPYTCVYEVRPTIGQFVSVAEFKTKKDLRIYDFTKKSEKTDEEKSIDPLLANYISTQFSKPYTGDTMQYLPTQFISEFIKHLGFDGIRYASSLRAEGSNVVLFSNEYCKPINSEVVNVSKIELSINFPEIYYLKEMMNDPQYKNMFRVNREENEQ